MNPRVFESHEIHWSACCLALTTAPAGIVPIITWCHSQPAKKFRLKKKYF